MLNKLRQFIRRYQMLSPGDEVVCAVSGGADSVALLFALYLLSNQMNFALRAAHFNHGLRGEESDRDEMFVRQLCDRFEIPLYVGNEKVIAGKKGLEAAARDARYGFLNTLPGKIATAHTADDNAETVLLHLVRGTGLKGLGGISPVNNRLIRPMLSVTRREVLLFLQEYNLTYVTDSSNETDQFMRNRLRHNVMPQLQKENPLLAENLSAMALRLRDDEQVLADLVDVASVKDVPVLRQMPNSLRRRWIASYLQENGVPEPESAHIEMVEKLIFSSNPSARACLSNNVQISRQYDRLACDAISQIIKPVELKCATKILLDNVGVCVSYAKAQKLRNEPFAFTVVPHGKIYVRSRKSGDIMRLAGGTKSLKKIFIDKKIPALERCGIPVVADDEGVLGVFGIGVNLDRLSAESNAIEIRFDEIDER